MIGSNGSVAGSINWTLQTILNGNRTEGSYLREMGMAGGGFTDIRIIMPNQKAKTRKRNRQKLNERWKHEGRTANQIKKRREKDKRNDLNRN